jgi:hypothetical protein
VSAPAILRIEGVTKRFAGVLAVDDVSLGIQANEFFALLAMTLSLDDFVITFFTSGPETLTFPVKVYSMVRFGATPEVNAASTILIAVTIVLTVIAMRLQRPTQTAETAA